MFRWIMTGLQALLIVLLLPMGIPDGQGGMQQSWNILMNPVQAWRTDQYLQPYQHLFQILSRQYRQGTENVTIKLVKDHDGGWHASNLPDAPGEAVVLADGNADLVAPTRWQGQLALLASWLLVWVLLQSLKTRLRKPSARGVPGSGEGIFVPYSVQSRTRRPIKDITPAEERDPRNEREAERQMQGTTIQTEAVRIMEETETERRLLS